MLLFIASRISASQSRTSGIAHVAGLQALHNQKSLWLTPSESADISRPDLLSLNVIQRSQPLAL
jgi:hypothetical protein